MIFLGNRFALTVAFAMLLCAGCATQKDVPEQYFEALELIHAFSGAGDELNRAMWLAKELMQSHPQSGYAETLVAEMLSTWKLSQEGKPEELRQKILKLVGTALEYDSQLAQAHVVKARVLLRGGNYTEANSAAEAALAIDANLSGAMFILGDVARRTERTSEAEHWYTTFIESTGSTKRQSNGYYWLGEAYMSEARRDSVEQAVWVGKARQAYENMIRLDPGGAWKNVNFAIFLNAHTRDFEKAKRYALAALDIMKFPMARNHLAIARYQQIWLSMSEMSSDTLKARVEEIALDTGITVVEAADFVRPGPMQTRLRQLQATSS